MRHQAKRTCRRTLRDRRRCKRASSGEGASAGCGLQESSSVHDDPKIDNARFSTLLKRQQSCASASQYGRNRSVGPNHNAWAAVDLDLATGNGGGEISAYLRPPPFCLGIELLEFTHSAGVPRVELDFSNYGAQIRRQRTKQLGAPVTVAGFARLLELCGGDTDMTCTDCLRRSL